MNKKKILLSGLTVAITASIFAVVLSSNNTDSFETLYAGTESGAKIDRSITVTDYVRKGFYAKALSGRVSSYDYSTVSFELDNPGAYGFIDFLPSDSNELENINDGLVNFYSQKSVQRIMYFSFEDNLEFYDSEADAEAERNKFPIYNFARGSVFSIVIKMGSRNLGTIKHTDLEGDLVIDYNSEAKTYTVTNIGNLYGLFIYSNETNSYFHIESITINYNC